MEHLVVFATVGIIALYAVIVARNSEELDC
jgi:hypothetical protein